MHDGILRLEESHASARGRNVTSNGHAPLETLCMQSVIGDYLAVDHVVECLLVPE